jgi:hypothetical protein
MQIASENIAQVRRKLHWLVEYKPGKYILSYILMLGACILLVDPTNLNIILTVTRILRYFKFNFVCCLKKAKIVSIL